MLVPLFTEVRSVDPRELGAVISDGTPAGSLMSKGSYVIDWQHTETEHVGSGNERMLLVPS